MLRYILLTTVAFGLLFSCTQRIERPSTESMSHSGGVNINIATVEELEKLPNIGRKTAESIVEFRTVNGPFRRPEHLMQIRGVSEARFGELRPYIKTD